MKIAHVGALKSDKDPWSMIAYKWLWKNRPDYELTNVQHDWIDLRGGRDFLKESKTYDIVILHMIYNPGGYTGPYHGIFSQSELHNINTWKKRLIQSDAMYIFVFGYRGGEISGDDIGILPDYDRIKVKDSFHIYERSSLIARVVAQYMKNKTIP